MPPRKNASKNALAAAAVGGRDDISNLPDDVLQHILSFLPAQDAVRTCVLAKRWRHLWKSTTVLRFLCGGKMEPESMKEIQDFVDQLLRLRLSGSTPLDMCEFRLGETDDNDMSRIDIWIRIALQCGVRVLQLNCTCTDHPIFISQYLKKLVLGGFDAVVPVPGRLLDFSCCPNLEDLEIVDCYIGGALLISSQSLKHLTIEYCYFDYDGQRMPICAPNLVSLWLEFCNGRTPLLQRLPSLLTASVICHSYDDYEIAESESADYSNQSIFLHGLSEVRNLSLISFDYLMFVFRRDLKFCSTFNNLKTLLLNEYWCEPADFSALACLLKLCPVLEKLTLQLYSMGPKYKVEINLNCNPLDLSGEISRHLKIVEVKCQVYDEKINNVLTFLTKQIFKKGHGSA